VPQNDPQTIATRTHTTRITSTTDAILVDFETFSKILNRPGGFREPFDIEEYIRGFQVFDKDRSGFVGKGQIKYILTNLGEKMSEEEVDELFKSTIDASNNEVDYRGTSASDAYQIARRILLHLELS
jgi:Ca2+-binding EF-hand superfamily protein